MTDILNLPGWSVLAVDDQDGDYRIKEEAPYLGNIPFQFLEQQYEIPVGVDISTLGRLLQGELDSDDSTRYSA